MRRDNQLSGSIIAARVAKFFVLIVLSTHITACLWYLIACPDSNGCDDSSWVKEALEQSPKEPRAVASQSLYTNSVYWAMATLTTVGYGDIRGYTTLERSFALATMLYGKLMYGYILGSVASGLVRLLLA